MANSIIGHCAICGQVKKLTFEHVPPKSALNNKPIYIQNHKHLFPGFPHKFGHKDRSNKGFGGETLCTECNNNTGSWYAKDFGVFALQGLNIIQSFSEPQFQITGEYSIKPLNVLKQIVAMFMSIDNSGHLRSNEGLRNFILQKELTELPPNFRILLYSSMSKYRRKIGCSTVAYGHTKPQIWSEINFEPFGYFLTEDSEAPHPHMCDITGFSNFKFGEEKRLRIITPYFVVKTPWLGTYH